MTSKAKDPNKKHYFNDLDSAAIKAEGKLHAEQNSPVSLWKEGQSEDNVETFHCVEFNELAQVFYLEYKPEGLLSKLSKSKLVGSDVFVKIGTSKSPTFTTSLLVYNEDKKLYSITINNRVFKTLQRQNYRLSAGLNNKIQIKLGEGLVFDGLDISAGGMSFLIPTDQLSLYPKDASYNDCTLRFNRERFNIEEVRVAGSWPVEEPTQDEVSQYKIGVAFSKLNPIVEEDLFKHINSVARVQEMTKAMRTKE
jgi:hypothetical protein